MLQESSDDRKAQKENLAARRSALAHRHRLLDVAHEEGLLVRGAGAASPRHNDGVHHPARPQNDAKRVDDLAYASCSEMFYSLAVEL